MRETALIVGSMAGSAGLLLLYARELSRLLAPPEFATASALLSVLLALSFPLAAIQAAVAGEAAARRDDPVGVRAAAAGARRLATRIALGVAVLAVGGGGVAILVRGSEALSAAPAFLWLAAAVAGLVAYHAALGVLLARRSLRPFAIAAIAEPIARVLLAHVAIRFGGGAQAGVGVAAISAGGVGIAVLVRLGRGAPASPIPFAVRSAAALVAYGLAAFSAPILARWTLAPEEAGRFAAASQVGRFLITLPLPFSLALVRRAAEARREGRTPKRSFWITLAFLVVTALWVLGNLACFPRPFLWLFVDPARYAGLEPRLLALAGGSAIYGLLQIPLFLGIALRRRGTLAIPSVAIAGVGVGALFDPRPWDGIVVPWIAAGGIALAVGVGLAARWLRGRPVSSDHDCVPKR